jgi:hypothetical protein
MATNSARADMKRLVGIALLVLGALLLVPVISGWFMWTSHMHTIGLSVDAERGLAVLLMADVVCFATGLYLIKSRSDATEE